LGYCLAGGNVRKAAIRFNTLQIVMSNRICAVLGAVDAICGEERGAGLGTDDHDFGGFDQRGGGLANFQAHLAHCVRCNDGRDVLTTDGQRYLGHQPADLDFGDAARELVAPADPAEIRPPLVDGRPFPGSVEEFIDLLFGNAVMAARGLDGLDLALVDPLFERRIADAQDLGCFARREKFHVIHRRHRQRRRHRTSTVQGLAA